MSVEFLITAFIVVIAPGTGVIYTIGTGLSQGWHASIAAAAGCTIGIVPHLLAAIFGLAVILHASALLFQIVKFLGVAFLLYLAWQSLKEGGAFTVGQNPKQQKISAIALRGGLINILNPKLSIFFLAFLPQFLSGTLSQATQEMLVLGVIFMAITFIIFVLYGFLATYARRHVLENPNVMLWLRRGFAAVFVGLGAKLAFEKM